MAYERIRTLLLNFYFWPNLKSRHSFLNAYSGDGLVKELLEAFAFAGLALGVAPALVVGLLGDHTSPGAATREGLKVQPLQSRELPLVTSDNVIFLLTCRRMALLVPDKT